MKRILIGLLLSGIGVSALYAADTATTTTTTTTTTPSTTNTGNSTKTTNVENGVPTTHIHQSDDPAVGDPVAGKGVSSRDDKGPANTQNFCEEGSSDPACARAAKRQTDKTTWEEDCASGATKACPK